MLKIEIERKSKRALRKDIFKSNRNFELGQVAHWITSEQLENVVFTELCLIAAMWVIFSCHELVDHLYQDTIQDFFYELGTTPRMHLVETIIFSIYRGFSPYANFITANFIPAIFQKSPIICYIRIYVLCFGLFYFISAIFWLFLPNLANANFG